MKLIDNFLDQFTMYRVVMYYLIILVCVGIILSFFGLFAFNATDLIVSTLFICLVAYITNKIFAWAFDAPTNTESVYITALILVLIVRPTSNIEGLTVAFWITVWAIASKFIFAINKKHIFNPAAFSAALIATVGLGAANWWVGTLYMLPFTLVGILIVRKIRRFDLVFYFFIASLATISLLGTLKGSDPLVLIRKTFVDSPIIFFAFVMLTEPLTTPPTKKLQTIYGVLVGILFSPQLQFAGLYTTPEMALLIGNVFSYIVSPKYKLLLKIKEKIQLSDDIADFVFPKPANFSFVPGQYMEWTLAHNKTDLRGNRRYFTIASSPTENNIRLGIRFANNGSSFKKAMDNLNDKTSIVATGLSGDFTLPNDNNKKIVFIAGGIGVTPFRAIIKYLIDKNEKRDIVMFYSNKKENEIVYKDVFDVAVKKLGIKTYYVLTGEKVNKSMYEQGRISEEMIRRDVPDFKNRTYYISGPQAMVDAYKILLGKIGIPAKQIITDYFPGFA